MLGLLAESNISVEVANTYPLADAAQTHRDVEALVKVIDPLRSDGADLQDILLKCNRMAMGEAG